MTLGQTLFDLYAKLLTVEEPKLIKHSIAAIVVCIFENFEATGAVVTAQSIEEAFKLELAGFSVSGINKT